MKEQIFGGSIEFENKEKLIEFIETIDKEMSIKLIEISIEYGMKNGLFGLDESYCLYKSLKKLKENETNNNTN